ncbi:DUF416 family protein [Lysobacter antibioticus]|uniref:DUF416 family protein n=1 Tax=Lysobacter antibioticus TaxID=84531 RepID=UPI00094E70F1|nr:DUF416 family protein [Lysobacter antibioticus]
MKHAAFDRNALLKKLARLDRWRKLGFGILCCDRLMPNYQNFQQDAEWGDVLFLCRALELARSDLGGIGSDANLVRRLMTECEQLAPSSEDFTALRTASAQDACFAVCSLLEHLVDGGAERIVTIATYATDSVDLYVQETEGMDPDDARLEAGILEHPLMQQELDRQHCDLELVSRSALSRADLARAISTDSSGSRGSLELPG